ncbi:hypothetical protein QM565_00440 [Geitlerinema splendidum]|nr:hypothetical protein [Geitlerinema splendidum]
MVKILPYDRFTIQTQDSLVDVIEKLEAHVEAPKAFRSSFSRNHAPYQGRINISGFEIYRIIHYRNSFLPIIQGRFEKLPAGIAVHVTMKLHPFVIGFLLFWCSTWYSVTLPMFVLSAFSGDIPWEGWLLVGLPTLVLIVFLQAFWYEANRSRRELTQMLLGGTLSQPVEEFNLLTPRRILIGFGAIAIAVVALFWNDFSVVHYTVSAESQSCSQATVASPYCDFKVVRTLEGHPTLSAIALSAKGQTLVSGGTDKALRVWDVATGELKRTLQSDSGVIQAVAIAPNGTTVVSGSGDRMVRIWDLNSDRPPKLLKGHSSEIAQVRISPDGQTLTSSSNNEIKIWDLATGELQTTIPDSTTTETSIGSVSIVHRFACLDLSLDGQKALVELGQKLMVWDLKTHQQLHIKGANLFYQTLFNARLSPDGQTVAALSHHKNSTTLKMWDSATGKLKAEITLPLSHDWGWNRMGFDGDRLLYSTPQRLFVWNAQTSQLEANLAQPQMRQLTLSADRTAIAGILNTQESQIQVLQRLSTVE